MNSNPKWKWLHHVARNTNRRELLDQDHGKTGKDTAHHNVNGTMILKGQQFTLVLSSKKPVDFENIRVAYIEKTEDDKRRKIR